MDIEYDNISNGSNTIVENNINTIDINKCPYCDQEERDIISLNDHILIAHDVFNQYIQNSSNSQPIQEIQIMPSSQNSTYSSYTYASYAIQNYKSFKYKNDDYEDDDDEYDDNDNEDDNEDDNEYEEYNGYKNIDDDDEYNKPYRNKKIIIEKPSSESNNTKFANLIDDIELEIQSNDRTSILRRRNIIHNDHLNIRNKIDPIVEPLIDLSNSILISESSTALPTVSYVAPISVSNNVPNNASNNTNRVRIHSSYTYDIDEEEIDNIPTISYGRFVCTICDNRYLTEQQLGTHFMISHNSYDAFMELDLDTNHDGFPGLELLQHIQMLVVLDGRYLERIIENKEECDICNEIFRSKIISKENINETKDDMYLDSRIKYYHNDDNYIATSQYPDNIIKDIITEPNLLRYVYKFKDGYGVPIEMQCCGKKLCYECLEKTLKQNQNIICPFCTKDHTVKNQEYIIVFEPYTTNSSWNNWWRKHADIFY